MATKFQLSNQAALVPMKTKTLVETVTELQKMVLTSEELKNSIIAQDTMDLLRAVRAIDSDASRLAARIKKVL